MENDGKISQNGKDLRNLKKEWRNWRKVHKRGVTVVTNHFSRPWQTKQDFPQNRKLSRSWETMTTFCFEVNLVLFVTTMRSGLSRLWHLFYALFLQFLHLFLRFLGSFPFWLIFRLFSNHFLQFKSSYKYHKYYRSFTTKVWFIGWK